ncbi:MAG TPA: hypothetical protein VJ276_17250 [Thermoanaerobaculia bacterium]|nr:hypothetical protein [Thermoanaerobaculia bacterium]
MGELPELAFAVDNLLDQLTTAFSDASVKLRREFESGKYKDSPFIYHMPRMSIGIQLTFSFTKEGVKGVFKKTRTKDEQELVSSIDIEVVATPRTAAPSG